MDPEAYAKHNKPERGANTGVYKHPKTGEELHATSHSAADAYARQEWVYDRPLPTNQELREATKSDQPKVPSVEEIKKLREELKAEKAARKAAEADAKAQKEEADQAKEDAGAAMQAAEEAEKAKTDATKKESESK